MRLLDTNPDKAYYGYTHVQKANEELAVDSLLISDGLFRSSDVLTRKKYVSLVESVREKGGTVYVFSTMHISGQVSAHGYVNVWLAQYQATPLTLCFGNIRLLQQLQQVSGVAAILRYPLPDLDELEEIAANHEEYLSEDEEELTEEERKQREEARLREDMEDMGF
jgi:protein pelota